MYTKLLFIVLFSGCLYADNWTTPATIIPSLTPDVIITGDIFPCYNSGTKQVILVAPTSNSPIAITYNNNGSWDPYFTIPVLDSYGYEFPRCCYDSNLKTVFVIASNPQYHNLYFSTFTNSSDVTTMAKMYLSTLFVSDSHGPCPSYNTHTKEVVVTWDDDTNNPLYSSYQNTTWSAPTSISQTYLTKSPVFSCYNSGLQSTFVTWAGYIGGPAGSPYYAAINQTGTTVQPAQIPNSNTIAAGSSIFCCYNSGSQEIFATWISETDSAPYYAIYSNKNNTWTTPEPIADIMAATIQISPTISCCYNPDGQIVFAAWLNGSDGTPYYSIYSNKNSSWSTPSQIPGSVSFSPGASEQSSNVFCCYRAAEHEVFVTWAQNSFENCYYATYRATSASTLLKLIDTYSPLKKRLGHFGP